MPIYEYRCISCKKEFECLVFRGDQAVSCPECKDDKVQRLMSTCSFKTSGAASSPVGSASCSTCASRNCSTCH